MSTDTHIRIVYDGDCPFCQAYVKMLRLKAQYSVELINARDDHPLVIDITKAGLDLDEGMVVELDGQFYHGDNAMHIMVLMTTDSGVLRRLTKWTFKSKWRSQHLYPILRGGRNLTLKLRGHTKIKNLADDKHIS